MNSVCGFSGSQIESMNHADFAAVGEAAETAQNNSRAEQWAIVEIFGHQRIAGRVSEQTLGGSSFVRVDVPAFDAIGSQPATQAFTKLFGNGAIYAISFVDKAAALTVARGIRVQPIGTYELRRAIQDLPAIGCSSHQHELPDGDAGDDDPPF
ncbi:hypothetical protein [Paraburkholderia adhaesiva]|uniref:hypothetical protein n=1 Tax=Paraburkholderia adhaesiva TaxID=2883244 RepID=UPI001F274B85|nr:hypothetical protein [Paraburkholderia adhaesiva]